MADVLTTATTAEVSAPTTRDVSVAVEVSVANGWSIHANRGLVQMGEGEFNILSN